LQCPGFETDIHGLVEVKDDQGKTHYFADLCRKLIFPMSSFNFKYPVANLSQWNEAAIKSLPDSNLASLNWRDA
jgi:hypothetical protein